MKKLRSFLVLLSSTLLVSGSIAFAFNKQEASKDVKAANSLTTFMIRVTDFNTLDDGDKVVLVSGDNKIFRGFGGNLGYPSYANSNTYFSSSRAELGIDNGDYYLFTLNKHGDNFSLRGNIFDNGDGPYDSLLSYCPETDSDYTDIGQFSGDFGAHKYKASWYSNTRTHWSLTNNNGNITFTNVAHSELSFTYTVYRYSTNVYCYLQDEPDLIEYYYNNDIDLHGMRAYVTDTVTGYETFIEYNDSPNLFYMKDYQVKSGVTTYNVYLHGLKDPMEIEVLAPTENPHYWFEYQEQTTDTIDYRGSYLLVEQEEGTRYYNGRYPYYEFGKENSSAVTIDHGNIAVENTSMLGQVIILKKVQFEGLDGWHYVAKNKAPYFEDVYYTNPYYDEIQGYYDYHDFIETSSSYSEKDIVYVLNNANGGLKLAFKNAYGQYYDFSYYKYHNAFHFETKDEYQNARLYRFSKTEEQHLQDYNNFITKFNNVIKCDPDGDKRYIFESQWGQLKSEFFVLDEDKQGYLANLTYNPSHETTGSLKDIINRYDYIISKYDDLEDFMDRKSVTTWQNLVNNQSQSQPTIDLKDNSQNSLVAVMIITTVSLTTLVTLVVVKKRRTRSK